MRQIRRDGKDPRLIHFDKHFQLAALRQKEEKADLPLKESALNLVFGEGNPNAQIFFLGEAPGRFEDLKGLPFVGQAGKVLDSLLVSIGLNRKDVFITSVLHYRPPRNRDPKPQEIAAFAPYIDKQITIINPKIIATLGRYSLDKFIPGGSIANLHGQPQQITWNQKPLTIIPIYHPAAALYRRNLLKTLAEDFKAIEKELKKTRPQKS